MTEDDAKKYYKKYCSLDPFPEIQPALLNSADVFDYINSIGMIYPFDEKQLNGVTLSLRVGDLAVYWDEKNEKIKKDIKADGGFRLKSNSIAYIQILEELRLPAYIIVRFNLRVTNTYRGLLLGTGPIVDPGFVGKINIPVHNLTNNDYTFEYGESLIEMEFTKVSPNKRWLSEETATEKPNRVGEYKKWKPNHGDPNTEKRNIDYYLGRANQGDSIQSSLPPVVYRVDEAIRNTKVIESKVDASLEKVTTKVENHLRGYNITLVFAFASLLSVMATIINIFHSDVREMKSKNYEEKIQNLYLQHQKDSILIDSIIRRMPLNSDTNRHHQ